MSALTKIAVVLLVVASLLLSAGVVVFVNKVEHFREASDTATAQYVKEREAKKNAQGEADAANTQLALTIKDMNARIDALRAESAAKDPKIAELNAKVVQVEQDKKGVEVTVGNMTSVQKGLQDQLAAAQASIVELRGIRDKLVDERHSLNTQLTDALSKLDQMTRAYNNAQERLTGKTASLDALERKMADAGFTTSTLPKRTTEGTPSLEGVVSGVFSAGGRPWASVTIGSKDNVEKGMKFNVVNNNEFLGYLTIQTTEPNEAAGVLEGPKVEKVRTGDQVKTQLQ